MESAPTGSARPAPTRASELRRLDIRQRSLAAQVTFMVGSAIVLVFGAGGVDGAPHDLQFLFLASTGLFSLATIHVVDDLISILHTECPRCAGHFFGVAPERVPSPFRRRCCDCGIPLADSTEAS